MSPQVIWRGFSSNGLASFLAFCLVLALILPSRAEMVGPMVGPVVETPFGDPGVRLTRDTGIDMQSYYDFEVGGTDLGIPFLLPDGGVGYLYGDTFSVKGPFMKGLESGEDKYRAQVMLRSSDMPVDGVPIIFDSAAGLEGKGTAPDLFGQWHMLANDAVSLPNGDVVLSYQHTIEVDNPENDTWHTDRSSLAVSHDGDHFELAVPDWLNDTDNADPYQMWSMQLDGDFVYIVSVRTGRQPGPMMLFRVRWDQMFDQDAYEYWNGIAWGTKQGAVPILQGHFGEPSLRKLSDGTWALSYVDYADGPKIVTRTLADPGGGPEGTWNAPRVQLTWRQLPSLYGGFIHPYSTPSNLVLMISTWQRKKAVGDEPGEPIRYDVSHLIGTL